MAGLTWPPTIVSNADVSTVEPRDVAKWLWLKARTMGENGGMIGGVNTNPAISAKGMVSVIGRSPEWPPTIVSNADVSTVEPGTLPEGTVCCMDPPYANTTGYQAKLPREKVLEVAQRWADAGATVCVSEAEPLPLPGWHHVEITECRVGQKRTFSKQKREWLTLNRAPAWVPGVQGGLL